MSSIREIAKKIESAGGKLYIVGGAVRDEFLGNKIQDEDYCVTGITNDDFRQLFPNAIERGKSFNVFDIDGKEFALARMERKIGKKHNEFEINSNPNITIEEDLKRRDITINAIAKEVLTGQIKDPFGGKRDIENKKISI